MHRAITLLTLACQRISIHINWKNAGNSNSWTKRLLFHRRYVNAVHVNTKLTLNSYCLVFDWMKCCDSYSTISCCYQFRLYFLSIYPLSEMYNLIGFGLPIWLVYLMFSIFNIAFLLFQFQIFCKDEWKLSFVGTVNNIGQFVGIPLGGFISDRWAYYAIILLTSNTWSNNK